MISTIIGTCPPFLAGLAGVGGPYAPGLVALGLSLRFAGDALDVANRAGSKTPGSAAVPGLELTNRAAGLALRSSPLDMIADGIGALDFLTQDVAGAIDSSGFILDIKGYPAI